MSSFTQNILYTGINIGYRNIIYITFALLFVYISEKAIGPVKMTDQGLHTTSTPRLVMEVFFLLWIYSLIFFLIQWIISILPLLPVIPEFQDWIETVDISSSWVFIAILLSGTINLHDRLHIIYNRLLGTNYQLLYTTLGSKHISQNV